VNGFGRVGEVGGSWTGEIAGYTFVGSWLHTTITTITTITATTTTACPLFALSPPCTVVIVYFGSLCSSSFRSSIYSVKVWW
jgi:hypothetical protein